LKLRTQDKYIIWVCLLILFSIQCLGKQTPTFEWSELPALPPAPGQERQPGLAGAFVGTHEDVLIVAGGANFPDAEPWEGGEKKWWKDIFVLRKKANDKYEWIHAGVLPQKAAYGVSVSTENGIICIGGNNESGILDKVWLISWDNSSQRVHVDSLPDLPVPLTNMAGAMSGQQIFIAGGESTDGAGKFFYQLDITSPESIRKGWKSLSPWPGPPLTHCMATVQQDGIRMMFYLMGGRYSRNDSTSKLLSDAYAYDSQTGDWKEIPSVSDGKGNIQTISAAAALAVGASHILILGGARGRLLNQLEQLSIDIDRTDEIAVRDSLRQSQDSIFVHHPGFSREILAYHTITQTWVVLDTLPYGSQVTTTAFMWDDQLVIPSGEISPGIRTPRILVGTPIQNTHFGIVNYIVLIVYLTLLVGLGVWFARKQSTVNDFFKGGNRIPWWAAGVSIFATQLSAITFMAVPAKTYSTDWAYFVLILTILLVAPVIIRYFLPFYRRLDITTAYAYLEKRFDLSIRIFGSLLYMMFQLGRLGIILLLPALALSVVTGIDVFLCVLLMGGLSMLYTVLGGIEAVIWTDVLQSVVLMGGALIVLFTIPFHIEGGFRSMIEIASYSQKLRLWDLSFDFSNPTLWVIILGGFTGNLIQYGSDQTVVQRYLTTRDEASAANGIRLGAWMALPSAIIFVSLGTALYVFFHEYPQALPVMLDNNDAIFPWFIATQLPVGISGILIAAIFAAAMSSLDSSMNSVATVVTTDFYKRLFPPQSESHYLTFARIITLLTGIAGTSLALYIAQGGVTSLWDQFNLIVGLFAGGLGGIFVLGIFSRQAHGKGALVGLVLSGIVQFYITRFTDIHLLLYTATGFVSAWLLGWVFSWILPSKHKDIAGLTYDTIRFR